jgi:hypothetical protein
MSRKLTYDPYIYAYMRACGMPSTHYRAYLTELTPPERKRNRKREPTLPEQQLLPTQQHPAQLDWVTPTHVTLARAYLKDTTMARVTARNAALARQHLLDAVTPRKQAGARRALMHAQAKHLAALVRLWDDTNDGVVSADNYNKLIAHAVPIELSAAEDYKMRTQQELYYQRRRQQEHTRRLNLARAAWEDVKVRYTEARRVYYVARARWRKAQRGVELDRATRRVEMGNLLAHASIDARATFRTARAAYQDALKARDAVRREWRACKTQLYRLNAVSST